MSARDAGSAGHMVALLEEATNCGDIDIVIYADSPAFEQIESHTAEVQRFALHAVPSPNHEETRRIIHEARRIIEVETPDAVVVGVSHFYESGLDEAFLVAASDRPRYAIQDYWGDVNRSLGETADTYFVLDRFAVELSESRHSVRAIACGSPKHARYAGVDTARLKSKGRADLALPANRQVIGFFGQALGHLPGYERIITSLTRVVASEFSDAALVYRPHPRESEEEVARTIAWVHQAKVDPIVVREGATETWLAASDVVVSCFSSCAYDAAFLSRYSPAPLNSALYLLHEPSVADYFRSVTDLEVPPPAALGLAACVRHQHDLADQLREALSPAKRSRMWALSRSVLPAPDMAARDILAIVRADLKGNR